MEIICCGNFEKMVHAFNWMILDDFALMPYIPNGNLKLRVNNCPSCGAEVRSVKIPISELNLLRDISFGEISEKQ